MVNNNHQQYRLYLYQYAFLVLTVLLPFLAQAAQATGKLEIKLGDAKIEQGLPVVTTITAYGHTENLNEIDLSPLIENFGISVDEFFIEADDKSVTKTHSATQSLRLRLYPRRTGTLTVPALTFHNSVTSVKSIIVTPAIIRGQEINIVINISETSIWQRQQLIVQVIIETPEKFSSLSSDNFLIPGMTSYTLKPSREWSKKNGKSLTALRTGWILHPGHHGEKILELPAVDYITGGTVERKFFLPITTLNVRALPPYIPPTIPVGKTTFAFHLDNTLFLTPDKIQNWQLVLSGNRLAPSHLPAVLKQIKSSDDLVFLTPETIRKSSPDGNGIHGKIIHHIPFKTVSSGFSALPSLRIQYFDPESARLKIVTTPTITLFSLSKGWRIFIVGLLTIMVVAALLFCLQIVVQYIRRRKLLKAAFSEIANADDWPMLRAALKLYAKAQGWPENITMTQWRKYWLTRHTQDKVLDQLLADTDNACYRKKERQSIESTRMQLLSRLYHPRPLL